MIILLPASLSAQEATGAILQSNGNGILVNNVTVNPSTALFRSDLIETREDARARIETTGSNADISSSTIVQFEGDELDLDHGTLSVNTSRGLKVRVGCITVTPVNPAAWTLYEVSDINGKVTVSALKSDVYIDAGSKDQQREVKKSAHSSREIVRESEQKSREEKCGGAYLNPSDSPAGKGAILNSMWAKAAGAGGIVALTCWAVCQGDDPLSPSGP